MKAVDLHFKTMVEKFIQTNESNIDFETEILSLFHPEVRQENIDYLLQNEATNTLLRCIVIAAKLLVAMKIKSNKLKLNAEVHLVHIDETGLMSFNITFTFKHPSTVVPEYLVSEIIYPRINTILLVLHEKYNVTFAITSYIQSPSVPIQEAFDEHSVDINYIIFPQCENPVIPLSCIYIGKSNYRYNLIKYVLLNSLSNYAIMGT